MGLLFSEYILEQQKVTQDQILEATIEQLRSIPSLAELMYDKNLIEKKDLFQILCQQQYKELDFLSSAKSLGLWTEDISQKITKILNSIGKSIGDILVEKEFLDLESLNSLFSSYVEDGYQKCSTINSQNEKSTIPTPQNQTETVSKPNIATSEQKNKEEEIDSSGKLNPILLQEYISNFEIKFIPNMNTLLTSLESSSSPNEEYKKTLKNILLEFVAIKASANFMSAKQSEKIADATIKFIEYFIFATVELELNHVIQLIKSSYKIICSLVQCMKDFKCEAKK